MNPGRPWPPQNHVMPAQSTLDYMKHIFILQLSESIIKTCLSGKAGLEKCMSLFHRTGKVLCMQHLLSLLNRRENKLGEALVEVVAPTTTNTITETEMKTVATSPRQDTTADEESNATTVSQHWPRLLWPRPRMWDGPMILKISNDPDDNRQCPDMLFASSGMLATKKLYRTHYITK